MKITLTYTTADDASALQWLPPEQTAGKTHPYLFSQCQATTIKQTKCIVESDNLSGCVSPDVDILVNSNLLRGISGRFHILTWLLKWECLFI